MPILFLLKNLNATSADIYKFANHLKKDKVGRNDLCHCGSGKKYKKMLPIEKIKQSEASRVSIEL